MPPGRLLLVAAGIHTLDGAVPASAPPRALLLDGSRIAWVGAEPRKAPAAERTIDLGGAWVTPAFVDAHVHATATGMARSGVRLAGAGSAAECLDRLRRHAAARTEPVLLGDGWDDLDWPEQRPPTADEITEAAPGRSVLLSRVDAHSCVVDRATLTGLPLTELDGVDRDERGDPTGWLLEDASEAARRAVLGRLPAAQLDAARRTACEQAAALGIGALHEMGHPGLSTLDDAVAWAAGTWPVDVTVWWAELDAEPSAGLRPGGDLFLDGSIGSHTAAVSVPYRDGGGHGRLFHDDAAVAAFFTACSRRGAGAGVHAIGDRAIEQAIAGIEAAAVEVGAERVRGCRHRLEHVELPGPDHAPRMARLGVVASVQPAFDATWGGEDGLYARRFGAGAARRSNPFRVLRDAGVRLALGSDSTVTPLDPWGGVLAAERHRGGLGVDRMTALRAATLGGRYAAGQDDVGPLRPGLRADLAVWSADPLSAGAPNELSCLATVVAGRAAHGLEPVVP